MSAALLCITVCASETHWPTLTNRAKPEDVYLYNKKAALQVSLRLPLKLMAGHTSQPLVKCNHDWSQCAHVAIFNRKELTEI